VTRDKGKGSVEGVGRTTGRSLLLARGRKTRRGDASLGRHQLSIHGNLMEEELAVDGGTGR